MMNQRQRVLSAFLLATLLVPAAAFAAALPDFRSIVSKSSPAVVKIIVEQSAARAAQGEPGP
ncbi:MAG: hypothetical protein KDI09_06530, partial [Halioglobus sp.]|nr:hypothetical protein [Halioglobus sp.]